MVNDVALEAFLSGVWTDVPLMATPVKVTRGTDPFGTWPRPSRFECEIDNEGLDYDPSRPTSLLYGVAGRNTRVRIRPHSNSYLYAEASTWTPERTVDHQPGAQRGRSSTRLVAEGLLRRIGTWSEPIRSPMYRTISSRSTSIGHWSLEDDRDALTLANSYPGGRSGTFTGDLTLGESESAQGAAQSVKVSATTGMSGVFAAASGTAGWQVSWSFRLPAIPASATWGQLLRWSTSSGYTWLVEVNNAAYRFTVTDSDGAVLLSYGPLAYTGREPNQWTTMRVKASASGGTVTVEPAWYIQGDSAVVGATTTFSGSVGALRGWAHDGNAVAAGGWLSHIFAVTGGTDSLLGATAVQVFNGYSGEAAGVRFNRVMAEQGLTRYTIGSGTDSMPMGPQRVGTLLDILKEIRATDDCRIDDERFDVALTMTTRRALYNQTPALSLTYPGDIYAYDKEIGDLNTHNRVTVKNTLGGEATVVQDSGPMSVQAPPAGVGLNPYSVDVNVADENALDDIATWHLAKGTLELPLYSSVTVNLGAASPLLAAAVAVREGNYITVTGLEAETVHLLVVGIARQTTPGVETLTFQCEPYEPYQVGVWDDPSFRYDSRTSTLNAGYSASATSMVVTFTDVNDAWSTAPGPSAPINANPYFETAVTPWTGQNGTVVQSATFARTGTNSLRLTPVPGSTPSAARSEMVPVIQGLPYTATVWMYSVAGYAAGCNAALDWQTAGGSLISSTLGTTAALPAGVWTQYTVTGVPPGTAAQVQFRARMAGTPTSSDVVYVDDATLAPLAYDWLVGGERITVTAMGAVTGSGPWTQTATVVRAVNGVSKAQTAGTAVHLADAKRWGL